MNPINDWFQALTRQVNLLFVNKEPWQVAAITATTVLTTIWIVEQIKHDECKILLHSNWLSNDPHTKITIVSSFLLSAQVYRTVRRNDSIGCCAAFRPFAERSTTKSAKSHTIWRKRCTIEPLTWTISWHCPSWVCPGGTF